MRHPRLPGSRLSLTGRGPLTLALLSAGAVLLLAAAGWGTYVLTREDPSCGPGVERHGPRGECVGVTDGAVVFDPDTADELRGIFDLIQRENARIADRRYATVAFLIPMHPGNAVEAGQILREVQGAYLAQLRANRDNGLRPPIRLVLASPGRNGEQWQPVAEQLVEMAHDPAERLRAVVGFNASLPATRDAIDYLTNQGRLPVVAGPVTADDLSNSAEHPTRYPGLVKIVPDNADQAAALGHYLSDVAGTVIAPEQTLLVEDLRPRDDYNASLSRVFQEATADSPNEPRGFTSPGVTAVGNTPNQFAQMVDTICATPEHVEYLYFAGRPTHLRVFVNALGDRGCEERDFTVITGSGASTLAADGNLDPEALRGGVTVQYTAIAHPDAWATGTPGNGGSRAETDELRALAEEQRSAGLGRVDLADSRTLTMYDAVLTAVEGIRVAGGGDIPSTDAVRTIWSQLNGSNRVEGTSGWICLDRFGNAYNKAVAIVSLDPERPGSILFEAVAWPEGREPDENCVLRAAGEG